MDTAAHPTRFLLRAEIESAKETVLSYAREVTLASIFVVTDWAPPVGTPVTVRLSFPNLIEPITVAARVVEHCGARGGGDPAGVRLAFDFASEASRAEVTALVARLTSDQPKTAGSVPRTYSVLLVEDNPLICDMFAYGIGRFFQQRRGSLRFEHADGVTSAWNKLANDSFDLVIVDYYLGAEDGASLIAKLRQDGRLAKVPVVAISVGGRDARDATISAGADLFLDKPVVLRDLFNTLHVLSQQGALA